MFTTTRTLTQPLFTLAALAAAALTAGCDAPLKDPQLLVGQTYASEGQTFTLREPSGTAGSADLEQVLRMVWLPMITVRGVDAQGNVDAAMAWPRQWGNVPLQKPCSTTSPFPTARLEGRKLVLGPADFAVETGMGVAHLLDFRMVATPSSDGKELRNIKFSGAFDMRDLAEEMGFSDAEELCDNSEQLGFECSACPGDREVACVQVQIEDIDAISTEADPPQDLECADLVRRDALIDYANDTIITLDPSDERVVLALDFHGTELWWYLSDEPDVNWRTLRLDTAKLRNAVILTEGQNGRDHEVTLDMRDGEVKGAEYIYEPPPPRRGCSTMGSAVPLGWAWSALLALLGLRRRRA